MTASKQSAWQTACLETLCTPELKTDVSVNCVYRLTSYVKENKLISITGTNQQ
jgi:hypothetical protein